jgi:hypothetical protein
VPLIEVLSGGHWSAQHAALPANSTLDDVSCGSSRACIAVGSSNDHGVVAVWNGSTWTVERTPEPPGATSQLNSVSCGASSDCTAVGSVTEVENGFSVTDTLAEAWDGSGWAIQNTPDAAQAQTGSGQFTGVSCPSRTACVAIGTNDAGQTIVEQWDGANWQNAPAPGGSGSLNAVACGSSDACTAIGSIQRESRHGEINQVLAELWSAGRWTTEAAPSPSGARLNRISCTSDGACTAAGSYSTSANVQLPLVERFS